LLQNITVSYIGVFAILAGTVKESVTVEENCTLKGLLIRLAKKNGEAFYDEVFDEYDNVRQSLFLMVSGVRVNPTESLNILVKEDDVISISPLLALGG
jgi:hypothetical protein